MSDPRRHEIRKCGTCRYFDRNDYNQHMGDCVWLQMKMGVPADKTPIAYQKQEYSESRPCPCWEKAVDLRVLNALLEMKYKARLDGDECPKLLCEIDALESEAAFIIRRRVEAKLGPLERRLADTVKQARELLGIE